MVYKGWASFCVPALSIVTGSAVIADPRLMLALGAFVAGISGLNSYFDNTYGDSTRPVEEGETPLNLPPRVDPTAEILKALIAKGYSEGLARATIAYDLEEAARLAKGGE